MPLFALPLALMLAVVLHAPAARAVDQRRILSESLASPGSVGPSVRPGAKALRVILGRGAGEAEEVTVDLELRALFNSRHDVGWLDESGTFRIRLEAGESAAVLTLNPGQCFDLAVRDTLSGRAYLASAAPLEIRPLDRLPVSSALEPKPAASYASRWTIRFPGTPVVVGLDATSVQGHPQPEGDGLEKFVCRRAPRVPSR